MTGAAGFVGSHLTDRLLARGDTVTGYDNLSTGRREFLEDALRSPRFTLIEGDTLDPASLNGAMRGCDAVVHLAANADVRFGTEHPRKDLEQNTIATFNVLEAARTCGVRRFAFASTGSVYGEPKVFPTPEDAPFPVQTSLYGASKLAGEGLIQAYAEGFGLTAVIFRFVSLLGERYSHGHVIDFFRSLRRDPGTLRVLGNGRQRKSYLDVEDGVSAMLLAMERSVDPVAVFNLGTDETCTVNDSIGWITDRLKAAPKISYTGGERGWIGDSPLIHLDCRRIRALGWKPELSIREAVGRTVDYLIANPRLLSDPPQAGPTDRAEAAR